MKTDSALVALYSGRLDLSIPAVGISSALAVQSAVAGLQFADGTTSLSPDWRAVDQQPLMGQDRIGSYEGVHVALTCGDAQRVDWSGVVYQGLPLAAVSMAVTNTSPQDQLLLRLIALQADPRAGSTVQTPLNAERALILNNGLWMDTPQDEWRIPVPEGRYHEGYWSVGIGEPGGGAIVAGIGEPANACASIGALRHGSQLGLELGGWLWADTDRRPLRLKPGQRFALQRMLILSAADLHEGLIQYADLVQRAVGRELRFPPYAGIETLRGVVDTYLKPYGLDTFKTQFAGLSSGPPGMVLQRREWTNLDIAPAREGLIDRVYSSGFTPDAYDSRRDFPHGIEAHVRDLKRRGYRPALVCRPFLNIRSGPPEYDQLAAELFAMAVQRWGYEYLMFDFNSDDYESADDTHTMAEGIRSRFQAVRDRVGPDVFIEACMVMPGPVLGIADGFRHACDWRGGTEDRLARQACARYYTHGRWFQLDHEFFDPQMQSFTWVDQGVQGMAASLDRVKLWTSFGALTGFSWLTGGVIENVSPERWNIFTRALPVYGRCARPLDLLEGDPPEVWVLDAQTAGIAYRAVGLFNWSEQPRQIPLPRFAGEGRGGGLLFDFWEQRLYGPIGEMRVELPPASCKVFFVHPISSVPQWIGADRHVTGAIGLERFAYDPTTNTLTGECSGPPGTRQNHFIYLPQGGVPIASAGASFEAPQHSLLKVAVEFGESGRQAWQVRLQMGSRIL